MLQATQGIILRTVKYSETSIIFDALTLDYGLRTYIINGVRKKNARVSPGLIRPMSLVEMIVYHQEEKDINRIKEIKASFLYQQIPFDVIKGTIGLFMTEVAQKSIKEIDENSDLFYFLIESYQLLDSTTDRIANFPTWWLVQFAAQIGIAPNLQQIPSDSFFDYAEGRITNQLPTHPYFVSVENTHLFAQWQELHFQDIANKEISPHQRRLLLKELLSFYQYHIENFGILNSVEILHSIFS